MNLNIKVSTRTDGVWVTALALVVGLAALITIGATTSEADTAVAPLLLIAGAMHVYFLVVGSVRMVAASSAPVLASFVLESGFGDEPSWIRSIVLGCWWFVAMELSWEAVERRNGARHTRAASMRRVQDVVTVVAITLAVGLIAASATSFAPVRSVAVQALVLAGVLAGFVWVVRHVVAGRPEPNH